MTPPPQTKKQKMSVPTSTTRTTTTAIKAGEDLPKLPHDLVYEILYRLPPEQLRWLRLVCKQWSNTIVNDPHFARLNLAHSQSGLLAELYDGPKSFGARFIDVVRRESKAAPAIVTVKMPPPGVQGDLVLEGSLNHSVLVRRNRERFVVDTLRGRSIRVPPPPPHRRTIDRVMCLGDSDRILCRYIYKDWPPQEERFAISVGGSPWRTIEPAGLTWPVGQRAIHDLVFADGAWHYLAHAFDGRRTVLFSVDASSEDRVMTRMAEVPFGWNGSRWPRMTAVEGRLTVVAFVEPDLWEIWGFDGGDGWRKRRSVRFDAVKGLLHGEVNLRYDPVVLKEEVMVFACGDCDDWHAYDMKREEACAVEGVEKGRSSSFRIVHSTSVCPWILVP